MYIQNPTANMVVCFSTTANKTDDLYRKQKNKNKNKNKTKQNNHILKIWCACASAFAWYLSTNSSSCWLKYNTLHLPSSQFIPVKPVPSQLQRYLLTRSSHIPCWQGLESHSLVSERKRRSFVFTHLRALGECRRRETQVPFWRNLVIGGFEVFGGPYSDSDSNNIFFMIWIGRYEQKML